MDKARKRKAAHTGRPPNEQLTNNDSSILASQLGSSISESLLPSQRVVRQRALLSSDLPRPESSTAAETRKKRKAAIASGRQEENSGPPLHNRHRRLLLLAVSIPNHLIIYSSVDQLYSTNMLIASLTCISNQVIGVSNSSYDIL
ncbi:uncharacterized protein LOC120649183 isoform X6 [Panicum virgatum]|uniref:uncharacterized protein LOC120649183 isoform X6 n=1 Tax=Panicum virgatum TaxID=38727 RepID=UPI0019D64DF7|nr:uncharacterized protein LOC120649183 isoform X6 [Panicum virgatum]